MTKIKVVIKEEIYEYGSPFPVRQLQVDSRAYANNEPIMTKDASGKDYHLGQISSSLGWAKHDMVEHFKSRYDELFPEGWEVEFQYVPLN